MTDPEIARLEARGDSIARAHDRCADIIPCGLDYAQRSRLTDVLAQVWDDGCHYQPPDQHPDPYVRGWHDCAEAIAILCEIKARDLMKKRRRLAARVQNPIMAWAYRNAADMARATIQPGRRVPAEGGHDA